MTDKEIIIDGEKENCKILFECFHIDDSEAYKMLKKGIKITPENAPLDDFEFRLIANEYSIFGFSSICKRRKNSDEWEYDGFGHTGASSIVTALLKQLKRKEQECKALRKDIKEIANLLDLDTGEEYNFGNIEMAIKDLEQECERLKEELDLKSCANIELSLEIKKYEKAIEAIEEIADNNYENTEMKQIEMIIGGLDV